MAADMAADMAAPGVTSAAGAAGSVPGTVGAHTLHEVDPYDVAAAATATAEGRDGAAEFLAAHGTVFQVTCQWHFETLSGCWGGAE